MPRADTDTDTATARLLADIGGTHARFGWQTHAHAPITDVQVLPCREHRTVADAIRAYLSGLGRTAPPACALAIANPVLGDQVAMTNHPWALSISALKAEMGFERLLVLNDFTALALALPAIPATELRQVGGGHPMPGRAIGLIGPGTGLGVSGLIPTAGHEGPAVWAPLHGEGGHVTLAGRGAREQAVLAQLERELGHVSAERAISGPGLVNLHRALLEVDGVDSVGTTGSPPPSLAAADITHRALQGDDAACREALELFCALLGTVAGNLALTLGALGGVYIGGGIVPQLGGWFAQSPFRRRFEAKGRFEAYLSAIPVFVIHAQQSPALLGAARALDVDRMPPHGA